MRRERQTIDRRPGSTPDIHTDHGAITFIMTPAGTPRGQRLIIRCDAAGEIWMASETDRVRPE